MVSNPARDQQPIPSVVMISKEGESPGTAVLPPIPKPVHPHGFAHTSHTSSCLSASQIGKRQDSMFSNLILRLSRTQPHCASSDLKKQQLAIDRRDKPMVTNPRENSWG